MVRRQEITKQPTMGGISPGSFGNVTERLGLGFGPFDCIIEDMNGDQTRAQSINGPGFQ